MYWKVFFTGKATKQLEKIPERIKNVLARLIKEIEINGPARGNWPNYSKLGQELHHCHLNKRGRPTYIVCWEVKDKEIKIVEVYHVSTREKAPY